MTNKELLRQEWKRILIYSPEELVSKEPNEYLNRLEELSKGESNLEDLSNLYSDAIFISNYSFAKSEEETLELFDMSPKSIEASICELIFNCMAESRRLHSEGSLEKEDLFTIEKIIDSIPLEKMAIKERDEFNKSYSKFKEYTTGVFLNEII